MLTCWDEERKDRPSFLQLKLLFGHLYGKLQEQQEVCSVSIIQKIY